MNNILVAQLLGITFFFISFAFDREVNKNAHTFFIFLAIISYGYSLYYQIKEFRSDKSKKIK